MNKNRPASVLTAVAMLTAQSFPAYAHNALPVSFGSPGPHHYAGGQNAHAYWRGLAEKQGMFTSLEQQMLSTIHSSNPSIFGTGHPQRYEQQTQSDQVQQNTNNQTANTSLVQSNNSASATQGTTGGSQLPANGKGLDLDLSSTTASIGAPVPSSHTPITITVGNQTIQVVHGQLLTPAEAQAVTEVLKTGTQSVVIGSNGSASGGTVVLEGRTNSRLDGLDIPTGVTVIDKVSHNTTLNLSQGLTNDGNLYLGSSNSSSNTVTISASDITNGNGANLGAPSSAPANAPSGTWNALTGLVLNATNTISNSGNISSAGTLTVTAGHTLTNATTGSIVSAATLSATAPTVNNAGIFKSSAGDLNLTTNTLNNSASISSLKGNVTIAALGSGPLTVNNDKGTISAFQTLTLAGPSGNASAALTENGGTLSGQSVVFQNPNGAVNVQAGQILGPVSVTANSALISVSSAQTTLLVIASSHVSGDPLFLSPTTINMNIAGLNDNGQPFTAISEQSVILTGGDIDTSNGSGTGGNVLIGAGADYTVSGTIIGPSGLGGSISVQNITAPGANVTLEAFANTAGTAGGTINTEAIDVSGNAGHINGGTIAITANAGSTASTAITTSSLTADAYVGGNGGGITVTDSSNKGVNIYSASANGGSGGAAVVGQAGQGGDGGDGGNGAGGGGLGGQAGNFGSPNAGTNGNPGIALAPTSPGSAGSAGTNGADGQDGGKGGDAGNGGIISISSLGNVNIGFSVSASGGNGAAGGAGGVGGGGGNGGNGGIGGLTTPTIQNPGGVGQNGGNGGDGGTGGKGGKGGDGGQGGSGGTITISAGGNITFSATGESGGAFPGAHADGGSGGVGGAGGNGGDGGAGGGGAIGGGNTAYGATPGGSGGNAGQNGAAGAGGDAGGGGAGGKGGAITLQAGGTITTSITDAITNNYPVISVTGGGGGTGANGGNGGSGQQYTANQQLGGNAGHWLLSFPGNGANGGDGADGGDGGDAGAGGGAGSITINHGSASVPSISIAGGSAGLPGNGGTAGLSGFGTLGGLGITTPNGTNGANGNDGNDGNPGNSSSQNGAAGNIYLGTGASLLVNGVQVSGSTPPGGGGTTTPPAGGSTPPPGGGHHPNQISTIIPTGINHQRVLEQALIDRTILKESRGNILLQAAIARNSRLALLARLFAFNHKARNAAILAAEAASHRRVSTLTPSEIRNIERSELILADRQLVLRFGDALVTLSRGAIAFLSKTEAGVSVFNLGGNVGGVTVETEDVRKKIVEGSAVLMPSSVNTSFEMHRYHEGVATRGLKVHQLASGKKLYTTDFSIVSAIKRFEPLTQMLTSNSPQDKKALNSILKSAVIIAQFTPAGEDYAYTSLIAQN